MKIYFAHPTSTYGTAWQRKAIAAIKWRFTGAEIVDPSNPEWDALYKQQGMQFFVDRCNECDAVVFAPFDIEGGRDSEHGMAVIGAGVFKEVTSFLKRGAPAYMINPRGLIVSKGLPEYIRVLSVEETRARLKEASNDRSGQ